MTIFAPLHLTNGHDEVLYPLNLIDSSISICIAAAYCCDKGSSDIPKSA